MQYSPNTKFSSESKYNEMVFPNKISKQIGHIWWHSYALRSFQLARALVTPGVLCPLQSTECLTGSFILLMFKAKDKNHVTESSRSCALGSPFSLFSTRAEHIRHNLRYSDWITDFNSQSLSVILFWIWPYFLVTFASEDY